MVSQKLYILYFGGPKVANQLFSHDSNPKPDSTTSLLKLQPCWNTVAFLQLLSGGTPRLFQASREM